MDRNFTYANIAPHIRGVLFYYPQSGWEWHVFNRNNDFVLAFGEEPKWEWALEAVNMATVACRSYWFYAPDTPKILKRGKED